ncbi:MAG: SO_0444 family Cu/Zn efflux transporter [Deltaproteobacteria bacterium]|nr:SO_0444 family Cu/Zn efflux transporter [Deltaproteobacteria bacterium]
MSIIASILRETWNALFLAAPFILFGLAIAGVLHVLISRRTIERWMGGTGLLAVGTAACFGVPLPICSCGVVPVAIELKKKGASRAANMSFLITTPESSVDSILLTWGLFGWIMAIVRPVAAFLTGLVAGVLSIAFPGRDDVDGRPVPPDCGCDDGAREFWREEHVVGVRGLAHSIRDWALEIWRRPLRADVPVPAAAPPAESVRTSRPLGLILRDVGRHAFVEMLDDIAFWLVVGLVLAGVISALAPPDLAARGFGKGLVPMLILMAIGIPMYMCASASTPVAAALVAKGISPGAALVFLLTGPATNAATVVLLLRHFGRSFVRIYLFSIAFTALACGIALDYVVAATGIRITGRLSTEANGVAGFLQWVSVVALVVLLLWRFRKGALRQGLRETRNNFESLLGFVPGTHHEDDERRAFWARTRGRVARVGTALAAVVWLFSGFYVVPADSLGYGFVFGRLVAPDREPGLHYAPPAPIGRADVWRVSYPRKTDVGFRTDLTLLANRRELTRFANPGQWHSPVAAMNVVGEETTAIAGDENLVDVSLSVHYGLSKPRDYFYRLEKDRDIISLYAQAAAREYIAVHELDTLLTTGRADLESFVQTNLQSQLDAVNAGVRIDSIHLVDIHPPQDAVFAFRDVSSAREDRSTRIHEAYERLAAEVPKARGRAALDVATAAAQAATAKTTASGRATGFAAGASAYLTGKDVLRHLLWLEATERVLAGREIFVVPGAVKGRNVIVWREVPDVVPATGAKP